jgi:uncharacterized membrane-anchored protein
MRAQPAGAERTGLLKVLTREPLAAKVPEITALFWVVKILTTAMGEAISDYFAVTSVALGAVVEVGLMAVALWAQLRAPRYNAGRYWLLAGAIAIFGTGVSDTLHKGFGIPYLGTTILWAVVLAAIFAYWYRSERTLSIHSIVTSRREEYYWATVFATFALGTALGDFTATALHLGYLGSGILFGGVICVPLIAWRAFGANPVLSFWAAYVTTRPLGASFADYLSKPRSASGTDFGDAATAIVFLVAVVGLVAYMGLRGHGVQQQEEAARRPA